MKRNILYLNPSSLLGGAEKSLLDLVRNLDRERYHPIVSCPAHGKFVEELGKIGFREDIPVLLASFDLFVLLSRSEGFGRVNLEAMAMGKPVISTNIGGIPEVILDGVTGILVLPGDQKALSHAIKACWLIRT